MARSKPEKVIKNWSYGTINDLLPELIKRGASSASSNFIANRDSLELLGGRVLIGAEVDSNVPCRGLYSMQLQNEDWVLLRKNQSALQYYNFDTEEWVDSLTDLDEDENLYFDSSFTPAGRQIWGCGQDGLFKIYPSSPADPIDLTSDTKNYKGKPLIEKSRMIVVGMEEDPTGIRLSKVDKDANYSSITDEAVGDSGSKTYTGTVANTQTFGFLFTDGTQNVRDDKSGTLIGDGTGTINYATGEFSVTFNETTTGAVTVDYLYEDSLVDGLADFTSSASRLAGEGNVLRQDATGTKSQTVLSFDDKFFTLQDKGSWKLTISPDDTDFTNEIFSNKVSCASPSAAVNVANGIVYIDTTELLKPKLRKLTYNDLGDKVIPNELSTQFNFEGYVFDDTPMIVFNDFVIFSGKSSGSTVNDTTFFYNLETGGIFTATGGYTFFTVVDKKLYGGDASSPNVYRLFDGYDDLGETIEGEVELGNDNLDTEQLKKVKDIYVEGYLLGDQGFKLYGSFDRENYQLLGEIDKDDITDAQVSESFGSVLFGEDLYGGSNDERLPGYYKKELKVNTQKFERVKLKIVPTGIGYLSLTQLKYSDIRKKGTKALRKYKQ